MGPDKVALEPQRSAERHSELDSNVHEAVGGHIQPAQRSDTHLREKLMEERQRREGLERRVQELAEENRRSRQQAEQTERFSTIQQTLQELGVRKVQLAFRLVKDDVFRGEDGHLYANLNGERVSHQQYLKRFVSENPEFLPPRIAGGSGATDSDRGEISSAGFDLDRIRPGMSRDDLAEAWKEVARLAGHGQSGW